MNTEENQVRRINYRLGRNPDPDPMKPARVKLCREDGHGIGELGRAYAVNSGGLVIAKHIDLDQWERELHK